MWNKRKGKTLLFSKIGKKGVNVFKKKITKNRLNNRKKCCSRKNVLHANKKKWKYDLNIEKETYKMFVHILEYISKILEKSYKLVWRLKNSSALKVV